MISELNTSGLIADNLVHRRTGGEHNIVGFVLTIFKMSKFTNKVYRWECLMLWVCLFLRGHLKAKSIECGVYDWSRQHR